MDNRKLPSKTTTTTIGGTILALVLAVAYSFFNGNKTTDQKSPEPEKPAYSQTIPQNDPDSKPNTRIGFASRRGLEDHFEKHGHEFGEQITLEQYLLQAQALRDAPAGGNVLEAKRADGVITRFDKKTGAFLAINPDRTIRTFFRPNDGERYFRRQAERQDEP